MGGIPFFFLLNVGRVPMAQNMLKFTKTAGQTPDKRAADDRRVDFDEIYAAFDPERAAAQASRCSQCGVPYCQVHCPLTNNIPDWLMLAANGRMQEAYEVSSATNNMPEICGRICPQDRLCEGNCVIEQAGHGTVTIGAIEKHITETAFNEGWVKPVTPRLERSESVGIVGAGPGGLAAADQLRKAGFQVHVYDRYDRVGGLLIYGIPGFKLEKDVVARREQYLRDSGVQFHLNCNIGTDISFAELRERHDAVLIATGVYKARELEAPGVGSSNIVPALDYLTTSNKLGLGDDVEAANLDAADKNVVVIGGGDTAMDCVRTAIRQGAKSVRCVYRRDQANMPGSQREVQNAMEEGVVFEWLHAPQAFLSNEAGEVTHLKAQQMRLSSPDSTGRQGIEAVEGATVNLDADLAIKALGFDPEDLPALFQTPDLPVSRWGTVQVSWKDFQVKDMPGVFAAGDIVRGASLVVWAVKDGRDAAAAIGAYLDEQALPKAAE